MQLDGTLVLGGWLEPGRLSGILVASNRVAKLSKLKENQTIRISVA